MGAAGLITSYAALCFALVSSASICSGFNMFYFYDDDGILTESENLRDLIAGILLVRDGVR
jgi:hypothetical protein